MWLDEEEGVLVLFLILLHFLIFEFCYFKIYNPKYFNFNGIIFLIKNDENMVYIFIILKIYCWVLSMLFGSWFRL